jgi:hypothetical protein
MTENALPKKEIKRMNFSEISNPHSEMQIPDGWENVKDFAEWWMKSGMPMLFPSRPEVFLSDDATAICLFRKGRFQVELYLIHPTPIVPEHEHPGVEVIKMRMGLPDNKFGFSTVLHRGESHGAGIKLEAETKGFPLIAFQHWLDRDPSTIASVWKGKTVGPKQDAIIRRFNPDAYVIDGYADTTRKLTE